MKKKPEPQMTYTYQEPKTKQEAMLADAGLLRAYDILFEEVEKRLIAQRRKGLIE